MVKTLASNKTFVKFQFFKLAFYKKPLASDMNYFSVKANVAMTFSPICILFLD